MRKKGIIVIAVIAVLIGFNIASEADDGVYTLDRIYEEKAFGFYVRDGEEFYPVVFINEDGNDGFQWHAGELSVPVVTEKNPLVAVFDTSSEMPEEYYIEKLKPLGYTIGANISLGADGKTMLLDTGSTAAGSDAEDKLSDLGLDQVSELKSVNGKKPISNIDTEVNILTGIQKNRYYRVTLISGTRTVKGELLADTRVFKTSGTTGLGKHPLKKTSHQYFVVRLPEDIGNGYYDICGAGIFRIRKAGTR